MPGRRAGCRRHRIIRNGRSSVEGFFYVNNGDIMISIDNLSVVFGERVLFDSVSFMINKRDRIGLTGRNGAGKSTLLKLIAGLQQPEGGSISKGPDIKIGYLPQTKVYEDGCTVREEAKKAFGDLSALREEADAMTHALSVREDYDSEDYMNMLDRIHAFNEQLSLRGYERMDAETEVVLRGLGFSREDMERKCEEFSGGWRMRIELAKILLTAPDLFLLDEPTNHLDIESIAWLESFLQASPAAVILVSHDRAFLDNVTERTIEISLGNIYDYRVSYTKFVELRKERIEQQRRAYENQQKQIKDTEEFIERFRYKATKSVQVQSRIKQLEKLERIEMEPEDHTGINLRFQGGVRSGDVVVDGRDLRKSYDGRTVFEEANIEVRRGEKVAFVGKNGEGKSTLVKMIMGEIDYEGSIRIGHNVHIGYFAQNQASLLDPETTVLDTVDRVAVGDIRKKIRDILGAFLFSGEDVDKKVKVLSGGERTRLAMVRLLLEPYNLLILDEPTNHLDIRTKDILKEALRKFEGSVIIVSHDRDFLNGLADKVYEFGGGRIKEYPGGIKDFLYSRKIACFREYEEMHSRMGVNREEGGVKKEKASENKKSYMEYKQFSREVRRAEQRIEEIERNIACLEDKIETMVEAITAGVQDATAYDDYSRAKEDMAELMKEWEEAQEKLENLKKEGEIR